jgi:thiosulfate/3-mercaptopyruvate sulfurtransferase
MSEKLIVSTDSLHDHLHDENLRIIDIRGHVIPASQPHPHYFSHRAEYEASHIPGAAFVDWTSDIIDPDSPNGTQIAKPQAFADFMSKIGVGDDTFVVAYDDAQSMFAARMWWALNYYGHSQVAVLDGGWNKWIAEGRATTPEKPSIAPAVFHPRPDSAWRRTIADVEAALESEKLLMDVRSSAEFNGESSRAKRKGHIPGAFNLPRKAIVAEGDILPTPEALRDQFEAAGIDDSISEIIVYCNGGVSSSYGLLALKLAGIDNATVYDGSWKEWGNDESKPIA